MRIISKRALRVFWEMHPDAKQPLADWYDVAKKAGWSHLVETRRDFPHADPCGECTIFNIKGNKYRLITKINYPWQVIYSVCAHARWLRQSEAET